MRIFDIHPWRKGKCEAGIPDIAGIRDLDYCDRRGRWMVNGVVLCGTCKKKVTS